MEKYKILFDYGAYEGMKFYDEKDFENVDEAVKYAVYINQSIPFLIVKVYWQPFLEVKNK